MSDHETLFPPLPPVDPEAWKERLDDWPIPPVPDPRTAEERLRRDIEYVLMRFVNLPFQKEQAFDCRDDLLHVFRAMAERILVAAEPVPAPLHHTIGSQPRTCEWCRRFLATPPEPEPEP